MSTVKDYGFAGKLGFHRPDEDVIPSLSRCKNCGNFPILQVEYDQFDKPVYSFFCNCKDSSNKTHKATMKFALELWNDMNRLEIPSWRELDMLRYIGIVVNPRTASRLFRWNYSIIGKYNDFKKIGTLENGLDIFICNECPEDSIRLISKTDLKNLSNKTTENSNQ
jgi:hypothetical protein